jgi:hypothetical protein
MSLSKLLPRRALCHLVSGVALALSAVGCRSSHPEVGPQYEYKLSLSKGTATSDIALKDIADESNDQHNLSDGEPSIAVNPKDSRDIAILAFSGEWGGNSSTGLIFAPVWRSRDGGDTWRKLNEIPPPPPFFPLGPSGPSVRLAGPTDQHALFDRDGKLIAVVMGSYENAINENYLYKQTAGPTDPLVLGQEFGNAKADQPHIASQSQGSSCAETVFAAWMRVDLAQAMDSASARGSTIDVGVGDNTVFPNRSARVAIAKDGRAYILYKTVEGTLGSESHKTHFRVKASDDCGKTWNALPGGSGVSVNGTAAVETLFTDDFGHLLNKSLQVQARARSSDGWIATDPQTNELYVTYLAKDSKGRMQVKIAHSSDRGQTWSDAAVTDTPYDSAYPEVAVAANNTVGVLYIDAEENSGSTAFRHRFARSFDHGKTWVIKTLQVMDPSKLQELVEKPFENSNQILWGDYEGLAAQDLIFYGVFTGASINRKRSQLDPIFFRATALKSLDDSTLRFR